jgi:putative sporulation protein YtaF
MNIHAFSGVIVSISSNVDSFAVALAYGIKKVGIGIPANLLIAFISSLGTCISMLFGEAIGGYLPQTVANALGSGVLITIGLWGMWESIKEGQISRKSKKHTSQAAHICRDTPPQTLFDHHNFSYSIYIENPQKADIDKSGFIDAKESIVLALSLTINNIGSGIGAGISRLNIPFVTVLTFSLSFFAITIGYYLGKNFSAKIPKTLAEFLSACLIILIGIYEYFN